MPNSRRLDQFRSESKTDRSPTVINVGNNARGLVFSLFAAAIAAVPGFANAMPPNNTDKPTDPSTELSGTDDKKAERTRCVFTGFFKIKGGAIQLESVCTTKKKGFLSAGYMEVKLSKGKYMIPGTDAYIYMHEGQPVLSYAVDGVRTLGVIPREEDGYSIERYLEWLSR